MLPASIGVACGASLTWVKRGRPRQLDNRSARMADYPAHLARERRLADGRTVLIRPIRPGDAKGEREFLEQLSPHTRRRRFMKHAHVPDDALLHYFTHIDYDRHMAFIGEARNGARSEIVGDARYAANADGSSCELGIVVADDWHHTGLAQLLMEELTTAARTRGLRTMQGVVLRENRDMLDFVSALGFESAPSPEDARLVRITKRL
jgi:acetyltransferase